MFSFSLLANSFSLPYLDEVLRNIFKAFNSKAVTKEVRVSCNWLEKEMNVLSRVSSKNDVMAGMTTENVELTISNTESVATTAYGDDKDIVVNGDKNPFEVHLKKVFDQVKLDNTGQSKNPLYNPQAIEILKKKWLPTVPFWTSLLLG